MERRIPIEPEELLSHARWMRALALSLVNDAASADDVVQESMVAALRRPPGSDRGLQAWLSRVVRNVASNLRRSEQRLALRHAERGAGEAAADPGETLERLDTQRLIVDLVRELDEPLRSTIVLRYFEGLSSPEIGRRMGVNDATVRWRMQKALDELRARLQRKFGSREAWGAVLIPFTHSFKVTTAASAAAGATAGAVTMGAMSKVAVAAASLLVGAGLWMALDREEPAVRTAEAAAPLVKESEKLIEPVVPAAKEREALTPPTDTASAVAGLDPTAKPAESAASSATVRARFVDAGGQPWDHVAFRVSQEHGWPVTEADKWPATTAGSDGRAELALTIPENYGDPIFQFAATRTGCATRTMHVSMILGSVVDLGDVVLEREARILGRVHDAQGAGLSDVTVGLLPGETGERDPDNLRRSGPDDFERMIIVTRSDARGAFELRAFPSGQWRLWGHRAGLGYGCSELFEVKADEEKVGVDFEVPALLPTDTISGVVLAPDGTPAPQAFISFVWKSRGSTGSSNGLSNADGRFEIILNADVPGELSAVKKELRLASAITKNVAPGARDLVIQLTDMGAAPMARLRVHGPAKEQVSGIKLSVMEWRKDLGGLGHWLKPREIETGLYEFLVPENLFDLTVVADGYVDGTLKGLEPKNVTTEFDIGLEPAPLLRGRVSIAGTLVPGATVEAMKEAEKGMETTVNGLPSLMIPRPAVSATSLADGSFTLKLQGKAPVYVRCVAQGFAPTIVGPIDVDAVTAPIEIELTIGGAIEGRARAKDGTPIVGAIVGITCGDGHPRTRLSGQDGVFRFEGLSVGSWLVMESDKEIGAGTTITSNPTERKFEWSCQVAAGNTTYFDLTLNR